MKNPFITGRVAGFGDVQVTDTAGRIERARSFTTTQCRAALKIDGLQKTVRQAIERRLRQIEKGLQ